ncbi:unnamed protein product [Calypogeia fissa]
MMAMSNSPYTPPPAKFSYPRPPAVGFDVNEAFKRQQDRFVPTFTSEQIAFYKDAIARLKEKMGSADREFLALSQQFSAQAKISAAQLTRNRSKNRYVNVLPFDENRVKLLANNGSVIPGDYINASFVLDPVHQNLPVFIATQGPLSATVADFWQMALQQRCPVIVMLTRLLDDDQERCAHYYPIGENQSQVFRHLQVTNKSLRFLRDGRIIQRILEVQPVSNSAAAAPHTLIHLEFRDWPDFGVPSSTAPVREMIRSLHWIPANAGPYIVHCSAGIGRTGTFCTIDHSLRRILSGDATAIDIGQTVIQFRSQRSGMVQTKEQYRFIYEVLVDELEAIVRSSQ